MWENQQFFRCGRIKNPNRDNIFNNSNDNSQIMVMEKIKILLVEDHLIVREGTRDLLQRMPDLVIIGEASNGQEGVDLALELKPDVVVMDIRLPVMNGIQAMSEIKSKSPETRVLILSAFDDDRYVFPILDAGANGYLLKTSSSEHLARAIRIINANGTVLDTKVQAKVLNRLRNRKENPNNPKQALSERELEILEEVARGKSNKEVGEILSISHQTVQAHLKNIYSKLQMNSRTEVAAYAVSQGWFTLEWLNE